MLDDVFAELDESRRAQLAAAIGDYEQVLITAAVFDDVPAPLAGHTVHIQRAGAICARTATDEPTTERAQPEHIAVYLRIRRYSAIPPLRSGDARRRKRAARDETSVPYGLGRDRAGSATCSDALTSTLGWDSPIAPRRAAAPMAADRRRRDRRHTPTRSGSSEGVLTVRVRLDGVGDAAPPDGARDHDAHHRAEYPEAGIESVQVSRARTPPPGNAAPEQSQGAVPRDTYG